MTIDGRNCVTLRDRAYIMLHLHEKADGVKECVININFTVAWTVNWFNVSYGGVRGSKLLRRIEHDMRTISSFGEAKQIANSDFISSSFH